MICSSIFFVTKFFARTVIFGIKLKISLMHEFSRSEIFIQIKTELTIVQKIFTFIRSSAICINSLSTFSASFAEVSRKYMLCLAAKSSPTGVGISRSSRSILLPTNMRNTLLLAYSSISRSQSGKQSNVGWHDMS